MATYNPKQIRGTMAYLGWVVEVLDDLIVFTERNGMRTSVKGLRDARATVEREVRQMAASSDEDEVKTVAQLHVK